MFSIGLQDLFWTKCHSSNFNVDAEGKACSWGVNQACLKINLNLGRIETFSSILSKEAMEIFINLQETYIFENTDDDMWFESAVSRFWVNLKSVSLELRKVRNYDRFWVVNID